jgi:N-acetylglutamate synthase-like GNAT family acetyltransferase
MPFENLQFEQCDCLILNQFYKQYKDKARAKPTDLMFIAHEKDVIHSGLRLLPYENYLFLRSVFTSPTNRGHGTASQLITHAINAALKEGSQPIYTLPTPAAMGLYERLGFKAVAVSDIPPELVASYRRFRQSSNGPTVMVINN